MRKFYKIDPKIRFEKLSDIIDDPLVIRVNEFDEEALKDFEEDMDEAHATGQPVIPIVIDSLGGCIYGCLGFVAAIESARVPVATIVTSKAMSAGAVLFCFGTEGYRFMHPHAAIMIHDVGFGSRGKLEEIRTDVEHADILNTSIYKRVSQHLGHSPEYIGNLVKQNRHLDWFLTSKQAKKHKIANHLRVPNFEVEINLKVSFT